MKLGAQMLIELRAADVLVHCGTCDRILFGEKVAEAERANAESG
jgi:predicted  nucleic acid-binding Zn-ribbon protein